MYLEKAVNYLSNSTRKTLLSVADISGVWLSSDDYNVFPEVQRVVPNYFPNVTAERIVSVSARTAFRDSTSAGDNLPTTQNGMVCISGLVVWRMSETLNYMNGDMPK